MPVSTPLPDTSIVAKQHLPGVGRTSVQRSTLIRRLKSISPHLNSEYVR